MIWVLVTAIGVVAAVSEDPHMRSSLGALAFLGIYIGAVWVLEKILNR